MKSCSCAHLQHRVAPRCGATVARDTPPPCATPVAFDRGRLVRLATIRSYEESQIGRNPPFFLWRPLATRNDAGTPWRNVPPGATLPPNPGLATRAGIRQVRAYSTSSTAARPSLWRPSPDRERPYHSSLQRFRHTNTAPTANCVRPGARRSRGGAAVLQMSDPLGPNRSSPPGRGTATREFHDRVKRLGWPSPSRFRKMSRDH